MEPRAAIKPLSRSTSFITWARQPESRASWVASAVGATNSMIAFTSRPLVSMSAEALYSSDVPACIDKLFVIDRVCVLSISIAW